MNAAVELFVRSLDSTRRMIQYSIADFNEQECLEEPIEGAGCAAAVLGHAILADYRALETLQAVDGNLPRLDEAFQARYSVNDDSCRVWPSEVSGLLPRFTTYRVTLVRAVGVLTDQALDVPVTGIILPDNDPSIPFSTTAEMLVALNIYTSILAGQLSAIRLGLGRRSLFDAF